VIVWSFLSFSPLFSSLCLTMAYYNTYKWDERKFAMMKSEKIESKCTSWWRWFVM
jgi:hypothetical protein